MSNGITPARNGRPRPGRRRTGWGRLSGSLARLDRLQREDLNLPVWRLTAALAALIDSFTAAAGDRYSPPGETDEAVSRRWRRWHRWFRARNKAVAGVAAARFDLILGLAHAGFSPQEAVAVADRVERAVVRGFRFLACVVGPIPLSLGPAPRPFCDDRSQAGDAASVFHWSKLRPGVRERMDLTAATGGVTVRAAAAARAHATVRPRKVTARSERMAASSPRYDGLPPWVPDHFRQKSYTLLVRLWGVNGIRS